MTVEEIQNHMPILSNSLFIWQTAHGSQHREVKKSFTNDPWKNHNMINWKKGFTMFCTLSKIHKHVKYMFNSLATKLNKLKICNVYVLGLFIFFLCLMYQKKKSKSKL